MDASATASILLVLPWSAEHRAGVSVVVKNLAVCFEQAALRPAVVVSDWAYPRPRRGGDGAIWFRFALMSGTIEKAGLKNVLASPLRLFRIWRLLSSSRAQAVNFHYPSLQALGVALLKRIGLFRGRLLLSFHGTDVRRPKPGLESRLWATLLDSVDAITACSNFLANRVAEEFRIPLSRITVIHNGVDALLFSPKASQQSTPGVELPHRYIASVGSYLPRKGHQILLEAFSRVAQDFPDLDLVIAGMDGPERKPLEDAAARLGLGGRLLCLVDLSRESVAAMLSRAAVCVQPSHAEPFGLAVIEAGACGAPLVASAVGGHAEILRHGETGLLFRAGDIDACTRALRDVLGDPAWAHARAETFLAEVRRDYTWAACAAKYSALAVPAVCAATTSKDSSEQPMARGAR